MRDWWLVGCLFTARPFHVPEGGSAMGGLITDRSHVPGCDGKSVRLKMANSESFYFSFGATFPRQTSLG